MSSHPCYSPSRAYRIAIASLHSLLLLVTTLQKWYRLVGVALLVALAGWIAAQPEEAVNFVSAQKKIVDDLYAG